MNVKVPKLTPLQWLKMLLALMPLVRGLVKATGLSIVAVVRIVIDLIFQLEAVFPPEWDAQGNVIKQGGRKLSEFAQLIASAFAAADESLEGVQNQIGDVAPIATTAVELLTGWGYLTKSGNKPALSRPA